MPITLDRGAPEPLHDQIADQLVAAIRAGSLAPGTRMPSTRTLAALLGVSRGVAAAGYDVLVARGVAQGREGSGTYVAGVRPCGRTPRPAMGMARDDTGVDFTPGRANGEIFPLVAWRAAWRQASCQVPRLDGLPALGLRELRGAVAEHLLRTRGLALTDHGLALTDHGWAPTGHGWAPTGHEMAPTGHEMALTGHEVVVTGGVVPGLRLVLEAIGTDPAAPVAVEAPAAPGWCNAVTGAGRIPVPLGVDADGARIADVPADCRAVVLSTEGHLGWGRTLSAGRRAQAVEWAADSGGTVVEMACDAVFRPAANRLPRLMDLARDARTVLVGGFCDALTPALGLGYAVVPRPLAATMARIVSGRAEHPPYVTQLAMAQLLADGTIVRLMHRRGAAYRHKRGIVEEALAPLRPAIALHGLDAAGTAVLRLPAWLHAAEVAQELRRRGIDLTTLDARALLLGYGHLPDEALRRGLRALAAALATVCSARRRAEPAVAA